MPRDGAGTYTLPAGNPVVTSTTISSSWANSTLNDIATALTNSLSIDGSVTTAKLATNAVTTVKITDLNVTTAKLAAGAVTVAKLDAGVVEDLLPAGMVAPFAMNTAPTGWLKCNGAAVSRTTYANLFAAIGTTWGVGDGSTTFNVPELRGEFMRAWDDGRGVDTARTFASAQTDLIETHTHTASSGTNSVGHTHTFSDTSTTNSVGHTHAISITSGINSVGHTHTFSDTTSSDGAHTHDVNAGDQETSTGRFGNEGLGNASILTTLSAGAHTHTVSGTTSGVSANHTHLVSGTSGSNSASHTHDVSGTTSTNSATHTHTVTVDATGGVETRPRNIALLYCIKT